MKWIMKTINFADFLLTLFISQIAIKKLMKNF